MNIMNSAIRIYASKAMKGPVASTIKTCNCCQKTDCHGWHLSS